MIHRILTRLLALSIALVCLSLPASAKRQKVTDEERAQAVMRTYDLLRSGQWVLLIDNITTTHYSYTQLLPDRNFLYIEDSLLVVQLDYTAAHLATNSNEVERSIKRRQFEARPDLYLNPRRAHRTFLNILESKIGTDRKGKKVVYTLYVSTPDFPNRSLMRLVIDPISLTGGTGTYNGRIVPSDETLIAVPDPYISPENQRTLDKQRPTRKQ